MRQRLHLTRARQADDGDVDTFAIIMSNALMLTFQRHMKILPRMNMLMLVMIDLNILVVVVGVNTHVIGFDSPVMAQILEQNSSSGHPVNSLADGLI